MSPRAVLLGDPVDARSEAIYALGCILYQMLNRRAKPFEADSARADGSDSAPPARGPAAYSRRACWSIAARRLHDTLIAHMRWRGAPGDRLASAAEVSASLDPALALSGWDPSSVRGPVKSVRVTPTMVRLPSDPAMRPTSSDKATPSQRREDLRGVVVGSAALFVGLLFWDRVKPDAEGTSPVTNAPPATVESLPVERWRCQQFAFKKDTVIVPAPKPASTKRARPEAAKPAVVVDSTPPAPTSAPAISPEEAAVRQPLDRFAMAMGRWRSGNSRRISRGCPQPLLESLKSLFFAKVDQHQGRRQATVRRRSTVTRLSCCSRSRRTISSATRSRRARRFCVTAPRSLAPATGGKSPT